MILSKSRHNTSIITDFELNIPIYKKVPLCIVIKVLCFSDILMSSIIGRYQVS